MRRRKASRERDGATAQAESQSKGELPVLYGSAWLGLLLHDAGAGARPDDGQREGQRTPDHANRHACRLTGPRRRQRAFGLDLANLRLSVALAVARRAASRTPVRRLADPFGLRGVHWLDWPCRQNPGRKPEGHQRALAREAMSLGEQSSDLQGQLSV